jgi:Fe-S oxidoreductase
MVMDSRGMMKAMSPEMMFSDRFSAEMEKVAGCTECGECEERCPYGLPVMELIREYSSLYQAEKSKYLASR